MNLTDKVCVITGAAKGIGLAIARKLVSSGAKVALSDTDMNALIEVMPTFPAGRAVAVKTDVGSDEEIAQLADQTENELGPIDVWINNAGVARHKPITEYTGTDIDWMLDVNVKGTIFGSQTALRKMAPRRQGHIINMISTASLRGIPTESVYCATKFAVRGFTQALQEEAAPYQVRVTAILPGGVDTAFWDVAREEKPPVEKFLSPLHIANAVVSILEMDDSCVTHEIVLRSLADADLTLAEKDE